MSRLERRVPEWRLRAWLEHQTKRMAPRGISTPLPTGYEVIDGKTVGVVDALSWIRSTAPKPPSWMEDFSQAVYSLPEISRCMLVSDVIGFELAGVVIPEIRMVSNKGFDEWMSFLKQYAGSGRIWKEQLKSSWQMLATAWVIRQIDARLSPWHHPANG